MTSTSRKRNDLWVRLGSALAMSIPFLILSYLGNWGFTAIVLIAVLISAHEFNQLMHGAGFHPALGTIMATLLAVFLGLRLPNLPILVPAMSLVLLGALVWQLRRFPQQTVADWALGFSGGLYLGWTGGHLAALRELPNGLWWLLLALIATWLADSGAYLVGRRFGRHKLVPSISPGKTWEGYIGGVVFAMLGSAVIGALTPLGVPICLVGGLLVGALSTLGDLVESMFKRQANAKDSGRLIPGHGGVFDRIDSMLWSGVLIYYLARFADMLV